MVDKTDGAAPKDWSKFSTTRSKDQYERRINTLEKEGSYTKSIKYTVNETIRNLKSGEGRPFVIFGEPQSGKTEMMIALNMRLLDEGKEVIVNLLTDSVALLDQSLQRFRKSGMNPSPKNFDELTKNPADLEGKRLVIFCKKNSSDLQKLITLLHPRNGLIVIDDEADYASPNANINKKEEEKATKINALIRELLGDNGQYIGVTATPARLNLNNTFENDSDFWVEFKPHPNYVGQEFFFPSDENVGYRPHPFESNRELEHQKLEEAIMHFLCGVAELNQKGPEKNYTMLVHTSGKRNDHSKDIEVLHKTITALSNESHPSFQRATDKLAKIATEYTDNVEDVMQFILENIDRHIIAEINSNKGSGSVATIADPTSLFSFGAGGNIISRGVTFHNLLSMFFTRGVKGKFSQDTYVQRARMFGPRKDYKEHFQLWIPTTLLEDWRKCFEFHKLALDTIRSGAGAPVWLANRKTIPTSPASIDRSSVDVEGGEMSFKIFDYHPKKHTTAMERNGRTDDEMLRDLGRLFTKNEFPQYVREYLLHDQSAGISFHESSLFGGKKYGTYTLEEKANIRRKKGVFSTNEFARSENPDARHHLKIFYNDQGKARLFYKINGSDTRFMQKRR